MKSSSKQPGLFDSIPDIDQAASAAARARMREMIDLPSVAVTPTWKDEMAVILQDGSFKRAMWLVPTEEGEALWAGYDAQMERLYAVWAQAQQPPES